MYYEIVRIEEQSPDWDIFDMLKKWTDRSWTRKALRYLANWDNGSENIGTAQYLGHVWNTPTDDKERTDRILREENGYFLCVCDGNRNGGYYAFYLTAKIPE